MLSRSLGMRKNMEILPYRRFKDFGILYYRKFLCVRPATQQQMTLNLISFNWLLFFLFWIWSLYRYKWIFNFGLCCQRVNIFKRFVIFCFWFYFCCVLSINFGVASRLHNWDARIVVSLGIKEYCYCDGSSR